MQNGSQFQIATRKRMVLKCLDFKSLAFYWCSYSSHIATFFSLCFFPLLIFFLALPSSQPSTSRPISRDGIGKVRCETLRSGTFAFHYHPTTRQSDEAAFLASFQLGRRNLMAEVSVSYTLYYARRRRHGVHISFCYYLLF